MFLSRRIVRMLLRRWHDGLPAEIAEKTRLHILDSMGISLAALRGSPVAVQTIEALREGCGGGACSVVGTTIRLPPTQAAFANSALAHAMDYDDIHDTARVHPTSVTLPCALAAGELVQASGETLLAAVALGNELMCRLSMMYKPTGRGTGSDWFLTQLLGYLAGAFAAALTLGLAEEGIVSALGLGYMQMAGGKEAGFGVGSNARAIYTSFAAMGGVQAALLARAGVVGPAAALEGNAGVFRIYLADPAPEQLNWLLEGDDWAWRDTAVKPYPSCRMSHPYISAALDVRDQVPLDAVRRVVVPINESAAKLCRPLADRLRPQTVPDAKYSIPFMTAFALAHGRVDLESVGPDMLHD